MAKNLNTQIWHLDSNGYTQTVSDLFTTTPPVYTHADHIDNSFNFCVNGVNEQKKRAVLHMTNRADVTYTTENIDNIFIGNWIYDNRGNYTNRINRVFGNGTGGVSNFAIAPNSGSQPLGGNFKILCNFNYLTTIWAPRIGFAAKTAIGTVTYYQLKELDNESTAEDAEEGETWWAYYTRKSSDYFVSIDCYQEQQYSVAGAFSSNSIFEGQIRAGIPLVSRVSWLKQSYYYGYSYGTDGCLIYNDNGRGRYADLTFDVIFSYSLEYMEKKDEYDDIWKDSYNNPYDRHNILYGLRISKDIILHIICSYGLPFSFSSATNITIGNADYALPEVKNNTTTGNYFRGADAITADTDNNRWANTADIDNKPAGGGGGGESGDDLDDIDLSAALYGAGMAHYYICTKASGVLDTISEAMGNLRFSEAGTNLFPNLISCKLFPSGTGAVPAVNSTFKIAGKELLDPDDEQPISIQEVTGSPSIIIDDIAIDRKFGDFRDYAPYTMIELYVPFCGWTALPSWSMGGTVSGKIIIDIIDGSCKAVIEVTKNGKKTPVAELSGCCSLDIPFTAENVGAKMAGIMSAMSASATAALESAVGVGTMTVTGGKSGGKSVISGLTSYAASLCQATLVNNQNYTQVTGRTGDGCNLGGITDIVLKIQRPNTTEYSAPLYVPDGFAHAIGFMSMKQKKVSECTGLIICDNVDTSGIGGATDDERAEIKRVLETGLYVNTAPE